MSERPCPHCGAPTTDDACAECGAPLTAAAMAAKAAARPGGGATMRDLMSDMPTVTAPLVLTDVVETGDVTVPARDDDTTRAARARDAGAAAYLALQPSEQAVLHAASRIYAAWIAAGKVTDANADEVADRAVRAATRMALVVDRYVQADDEDW
ncbi:MAG: zinc ribbon domain-containing protein [Kofleriaceae bacterium]|nr:zinc ribbon domain-containing protein [Kofleriaceae bacterium]